MTHENKMTQETTHQYNWLGFHKMNSTFAELNKKLIKQYLTEYLLKLDKKFQISN